jgi:drug/metabolite transporter (DMT)-like permease
MPWTKKWFQYLILLFLAFIWGSSFILMKIGLKSFNSSQVAAMRILFASLFLLPYSIKNLKKVNKKNIKSLLISGFIGSFIPAFLFTKAQTKVDSSIAGMLNSLTTVFTFVIGIIFYKTGFKRSQFGGLLLGLGGALGLLMSTKGLQFGMINTYALFIILATWFYGINANEIKTHLSHFKGIETTSLVFFFVGPVALIYLLTRDFSNSFTHTDWPLHFSAIAVLGIIGTASAMVILNSLIRYTSAIFTSSVTYIIPIFAVGWGILDGEQISILHLVFMSIILVGVYIINRKK